MQWYWTTTAATGINRPCLIISPTNVKGPAPILSQCIISKIILTCFTPNLCPIDLFSFNSRQAYNLTRSTVGYLNLLISTLFQMLFGFLPRLVYTISGVRIFQINVYTVWEPFFQYSYSVPYIRSSVTITLINFILREWHAMNSARPKWNKETISRISPQTVVYVEAVHEQGQTMSLLSNVITLLSRRPYSSKPVRCIILIGWKLFKSNSNQTKVLLPAVL